MRHRRLRRWVLGGVLGVYAMGGSLNAQERPGGSPVSTGAGPVLRLTLRDLDSLVRRRNPAWLGTQYEVAEARADLITARLRPNPTVNLQADVIPSNFAGYRPTQQQLGVSVGMPWERGNKRALRTVVAERGAALTQTRAIDVLREQLTLARLAWYDLLSARAAEQIAQSTLDTYDRLAAIAKVRVEARQIADAEYARILVERGRAAVALDAQRESSVRASLALTHLLGLAVPVEPSDSLRRAEAPVLNSDSLLQHALSRRPDALAARQALELTDANERLQAALAKPSVTIALDALVQQGQQMYGPSVSLPWAHFDRNQGEREKARVRRAAARYDVEVTERRIRLEVEEALAIVRLRTATLARFDDGGSEGIVQRAQSATAAAEFAYRNGATSLVELLDAERSYDEVRRAHAEAIADYNKSLVLLSNVTWQVPEGQK